MRRWRFERLTQAGLDAVVCLLPQHMLMFSGYRPRLGSGLALATREGEVALAVPADEVELARAAGVERVHGYESVTLQQWVPVEQAIASALKSCGELLPRGARVGFEDGALMTPNAYVSTLQAGDAVQRILSDGLPGGSLVPASALLRELRSRKTDAEIALVRQASRLGKLAFDAALATMQPGRTEQEVAAAAIAALAGAGRSTQRGDAPALPATADRGGWVWVMSGPNSALAYRAFAMTGTRRLERGDLVLVHMNPQVEGFWGDITRTFVLGEPDAQRRTMLEAVLLAGAQARGTIAPGVAARDVDAAARGSLTEQGYGAAFKHQTGHGVGFNGISGTDAPSLHPLSTDVLEPGMCFNAEPAVYLDGIGGCRQCDVLALTAGGVEELTDYLTTLPQRIVPC